MSHFVRLACISSREYIVTKDKEVTMKRVKIVILVLQLLVLLFSASAFASNSNPSAEINSIGYPQYVLNGDELSFNATISEPGRIVATLVLSRGGVVLSTWIKTGYSFVKISGSYNVTSGNTYTLTLSGTVNGIEFNPTSVTVTP